MPAEPVPFATVDDLAAMWRPLSAAEQLRAEVLLPVASAAIRREVPGIDAQIAVGAMDPEIPRWVACQMVKRVMASPMDAPPLTQQQQSVGSVSAGMTFANPSGDMYIGRAELKMLGKHTGRAETVSTFPRRRRR